MLANLLHVFGSLIFCLAWLSTDHFRPWVNFHAETMSLLGIGLLACSVLLQRPAAPWVMPRIVGWVFFVALIPWVQWALGISFYAGDALVSSLFMCALAVAIGLGYRYATQADTGGTQGLSAVFYGLWVAALLSAAVGVVQWLSVDGLPGLLVVYTDPGEQSMGNMAQPNQFATLLLMGIAALAWTFERRAIGWTGLVVGVGFMTWVLALTQSRAGFVSAFVMGLFLVWKSRTPSSRMRPGHALAWLVFFYALVRVLLPAVNEALLLTGPRAMSLAVDGPRLTIWKQMVHGILHAPWVGYGWNQTHIANAYGGLVVPGTATYTNGHNIVLDVLAWVGIPLGLLLTGVCAYWFVSRMVRVAKPVGMYAMASLLPVLVHSMVEFPFAYAYFLLASGLMIGIVEASCAGGGVFHAPRRLAGVFLAGWFLLGGYMVYEYLLIEEDFRIVRFESVYLQTPAEYEVPHVWMLSHMASMLKAARQEAYPGMPAAALENLRMSSLRFPFSVLRVRYAVALGLNGDPDGARLQLAMARGMYGERLYRDAIVTVRNLERDKYPELSAVTRP